MDISPSQAFTVRFATLTDVERVADLWVAFTREHNRRFLRRVRTTLENRRAMAVHLADLVKIDQVLVVEQSGNIAGFAAIVADKPGLDVYFASASISDLYVVPALRGQGAGRALLAAAVAAIKSRGLHAVRISVRSSNRAALDLYRTAGFLAETEALVLPLIDGAVKFGSEARG